MLTRQKVSTCKPNFRQGLAVLPLVQRVRHQLRRLPLSLPSAMLFPSSHRVGGHFLPKLTVRPDLMLGTWYQVNHPKFNPSPHRTSPHPHFRPPNPPISFLKVGQCHRHSDLRLSRINSCDRSRRRRRLDRTLVLNAQILWLPTRGLQRRVHRLLEVQCLADRTTILRHSRLIMISSASCPVCYCHYLA